VGEGPEKIKKRFVIILIFLRYLIKIIHIIIIFEEVWEREL
jgi:hypothetical protein